MISKLKLASQRCGLVLGVLLLAATLCSGSKPYQPVFGDPLSERWRWRSFPDLSGLDVWCMTEGTRGTVWFGTANGLWSFDGFAWARHTDHVGRLTTTLCRDEKGTVYAGGDWGISRFHGGDWVELLSVPAGRIRQYGDLPIGRLAVAPDGSLWATTDWGVLRWRQSIWTLYTDAEGAERVRREDRWPAMNIELLPEAVTADARTGDPSDRRFAAAEIFADAQGRVWVGTPVGSVLCRTPIGGGEGQGTWSILNRTNGVGLGAVTSLSQMQDGTIWVVHAASDRADVFDGHTWRTASLPLFLPALDLGDAGGRLMQTRDGVMWLAARYVLFAFRDGKWHQYGQPDLPYPSTRNVVQQSTDGALWFSGPNSEIFRIDYQTPRWLTLEDLNFQWESPAGAEWFLHRDGRIVVHEAGGWTSYGVEDGLIDTPVAVWGTRRGVVWVAGSHDHTAATARFDGSKWTRDLHPAFSFAIDWRAMFESSDGSMWFGAFVDTDGPAQHRNGILQFREGEWIHHHQPGRSPHADGRENPITLLPPSEDPDHPIEKFSVIGESRDGKIWAGRSILAFHDGKKWEKFVPAGQLPRGNVESMLTTRGGDLWIGTRESGAFRFDGREWRQFHLNDGLMANSIRSLAETTDGSIWAVTDRGSARFDGNSWMDDVLPESLQFPHEGGNLKASPSGKLWINRYTLYWMRRAWAKSPPPDPRGEFRTVCHQFRGEAPRTTLAPAGGVISQPGNLAVLWSGVKPWSQPKEARLQFSFRLDDEPWSAFTSEQGHSFFTLPPGPHRLLVRARDADFNVDASPAEFDFVVLPPVWRQPWFLLLMLVLGGLIVAQTVRVVFEQARLRRAHDELEVRVRQRTAELESANRELASANRELEAFSYSVSHDLRAPLRSIDGFSKALIEDYAPKLDAEGRDDLQRVRAAAQRMGQLIDDMLKLARVTRSELRASDVDLSALAGTILGELAHLEPARQVRVSIAPGVVVRGDGNLLRIALENLLGNAWKFTSKRPHATIEFGMIGVATERVYFVRDDGAGFDMAGAGKLFGAFQRLHSSAEFPGTGIGLAIVQRVVLRHGGRVWAEGASDLGATFFFTLGKQAPESISRPGRDARPL